MKKLYKFLKSIQNERFDELYKEFASNHYFESGLNRIAFDKITGPPRDPEDYSYFPQIERIEIDFKEFLLEKLESEWANFMKELDHEIDSENLPDNKYQIIQECYRELTWYQEKIKRNNTFMIGFYQQIDKLIDEFEIKYQHLIFHFSENIPPKKLHWTINQNEIAALLVILYELKFFQFDNTEKEQSDKQSLKPIGLFAKHSFTYRDGNRQIKPETITKRINNFLEGEDDLDSALKEISKLLYNFSLKNLQRKIYNSL